MLLKVNATLLPHQVAPDHVKDPYRFRINVAGRRVGKSHDQAVLAVKMCLRYPDISWVLGGQTFRDANKVLARAVLKVLSDYGLAPMMKGGSIRSGMSRPDNVLTFTFANGSRIECLSVSDPDSLRGNGYHGGGLDEAAFGTEYAFNLFDSIISNPMPDGSNNVVNITTTPNGTNWLWEKWFAHPRRDPEVVFFNGLRLPPVRPPSTHSNPYLGKHFVESFSQRLEGTDLGRQEVYGEFISMAGLVYKLDAGRHTRHRTTPWPSGPADCDDVIAGLDHGSTNPTAFIVEALFQGKWLSVAEGYKPVGHNDELADLVMPIAKLWKPRVIVADHLEIANEHLRRLGLNVQKAAKGEGSVQDGIRAVQRAASGNALSVDTEACPNLWDELTRYRWATGRDGKPKTPAQPEKVHDHACDALRYALHSADTPAPQLAFAFPD